MKKKTNLYRNSSAKLVLDFLFSISSVKHISAVETVVRTNLFLLVPKNIQRVKSINVCTSKPLQTLMHPAQLFT